jgi:hypothetical protein
MDELEWHQWLVAEVRGFSFAARLTRQVIAEDMVSPGQRRRMLAAMRDGATPTSAARPD